MTCRRNQRRRTLPGRGMATLGNHGVVSAATGVRLDTQLHLLLHPVEVYPGQSIYFLLQIHLSWTELGVLSRNKDWISEHQPPVSDLAPLVQNNCELSPSTPLAYIQKVHPTRPLHNLFPSQPSLKHLSNSSNPPRPWPHNNLSPSQPI